VKSADFSIASVARAVEALALGGPKAQSIRNAEGKDFRDLIRAYIEEFGEPARGKSESSEDERIVGSIAANQRESKQGPSNRPAQKLYREVGSSRRWFRIAASVDAKSDRLRWRAEVEFDRSPAVVASGEMSVIWEKI
jgi:CRISPR/Cas system CSM-associated protein Csm3 (group 7 of RAMP superfamily)